MAGEYWQRQSPATVSNGVSIVIPPSSTERGYTLTTVAAPAKNVPGTTTVKVSAVNGPGTLMGQLQVAGATSPTQTITGDATFTVTHSGTTSAVFRNFFDNSRTAAFYLGTEQIPTTPPVTPTTNLPMLLGAVAASSGAPLGTLTGPTDDLARDIGDQAGKVIRDDGYGTYAAEPWPTATGTPVLVVSTGVNLIATDSGLDIDTSGFAQQVKVVYEWETTNPDYAAGKKVKYEDGTVGDPYRTIAHRVEATSSPSHGPITITVERERIPVTQTQAQAVADALGARAWLRGQTLSVTCSLALWVRPLDTVRVDLPYGPPRDLLVSSARHDYSRKTSTLVLRPATLSVWPLEA